jgi:hypothetical protein
MRACLRARRGSTGNMGRSLPRAPRMDKAGRGPDSPAHGVARGRYLAGGAAARRERRDPRGLHRGAGPVRGRGAGRRLAPDGPDPAAGRAARRDMARAALGAYRQLPGGARAFPRRRRYGRSPVARGAGRRLRAPVLLPAGTRALSRALCPDPRASRRARGGALGGGLSRVGGRASVRDGLWPQPRTLRGHRLLAGPRLCLAAHRSGRLAGGCGAVCRPAPALPALPFRDAGGERCRPRRRAPHDGVFPPEPPRALARRPAACRRRGSGSSISCRGAFRTARAGRFRAVRAARRQPPAWSGRARPPLR